jgi:hypothetical protein
LLQTGRAGSDVAHDHVNFVSARREWNCFLISRLAIFRFAELFGGGGCDYRILEDADTTAGHRGDAREDVHARLLQTAAVLEDQIFVLGLNRERSDYALV